LRFAVAAFFGLLLAVWLASSGARAVGSGGTEIDAQFASPAPTPVTDAFRRIPFPEPEFKRSGGPYISDQQAVAIAVQRSASGPKVAPARIEAHLMNYSDVVDWANGARTFNVALDREVFMVVVSARFVGLHGHGPEVVCMSYVAIVDATDGTLHSAYCGGQLPWPANLPGVFG
jgi:hypothetical protein